MNRQDAKTPRTEPNAELDRLAKAVVDASYHVHTELGPGLLERVYEICLAHRLRQLGFKAERQVDFPVFYDGVEIDAGFRLDLLVNDKLIIELKTVEILLPLHKAQVLTYLKLSKRELGLLINFNVPLIKDGIKRIVCTSAKLPPPADITL